MKRFSLIVLVLFVAAFIVGCGDSGCKKSCGDAKSCKDACSKWITMFNGKDLTGWKASEKEGCFSVENGAIKVSNGRSHLFYVGDGSGVDFKDFELVASVMTTPGSNSGIYFHTKYQQEGWPANGYETQVNISHSDPKKSGSLYDVVNVSNPPAKDNEWYTHRVVVKGKHVTVEINGEKVVDYTEPEDVNFPGWPGRKLSSGTFCLQGHDPKSVVYFKDLKVRPL